MTTDNSDLQAARRLVADHECSTQGHDFRVMTALGSLDPRRIVCDRCGHSWGVEVRP